MDSKELYLKLAEAYSEVSLNKISLVLISLYKEGQFDTLNKIAEMISDFEEIEITSTGKGFSKFMKLYHPDRGDYHRNILQQLLQANDYDRLLEYSHILKLTHIDEIASSIESFEDIDYSPVYEWDMNSDGFNLVTDKDSSIHHENTRQDIGYTFYDAIKIRMYGNTKVEFPSYYLEDIDEFELSGSMITNLEGVEFCKQTINMDLSENQICDISDLWGLSNLETLNIADNKISNIDSLSNLTNLRWLNISNNNISDISPLFELPNLEYVNLLGNLIPPFMVKALEESGVNLETTLS